MDEGGGPKGPPNPLPEDLGMECPRSADCD